MALIQTVAMEDAEGKVKEVYGKLMETVRVIPRPMLMMSVSPDLLAIQIQFLGFGLLAHIRLLVADYINYPYCVEFTSGLLQMLSNITDEQLDTVKADPAAAPLEDKDIFEVAHHGADMVRHGTLLKAFKMAED